MPKPRKPTLKALRQNALRVAWSAHDGQLLAIYRDSAGQHWLTVTPTAPDRIDEVVAITAQDAANMARHWPDFRLDLFPEVVR